MVRLAFPVALAALSSPLGAQQHTASAVIAVSAYIEPSCTVETTPLVLTGSGPRQPSQIAVTCGPNEIFSVSLDRGANPGPEGRRVRDVTSGRTLAYDVFRDAAHQVRWGEGAGDAAPVETDQSGKAVLLAYGTFGPGQVLRPGLYTDQLVVTIGF